MTRQVVLAGGQLWILLWLTMLNPANLPDDMDALKVMLSASLAVIADRDAVIERKEDRIIRLEKLLADFKRALFGHRSEKSDPEQYELALEDIETAIAAIHAEDEAVDPPKSSPAKPRNANRGSLPKHLPRIEEVIEPDTQICVCGGGLHCIGEDVSERLDVIRPSSASSSLTARSMPADPARTVWCKLPPRRG